jgi:hypothetical protein
VYNNPFPDGTYMNHRSYIIVRKLKRKADNGRTTNTGDPAMVIEKIAIPSLPPCSLNYMEV